MIFKSLPIGQWAEQESCLFFFGNRNSSLTSLQKEFPNLEFIRLKQFHSDLVVESSQSINPLAEADAHFTRRPGIGLCINTADCVPLLLHDRKSHQIAAIHAGWRGVAQRILPKTLEHLIAKGWSYPDTQIVMGPHIQMESFEVRNDVRDEILASIQQPTQKHFATISTEKSRVHLSQVLLSQLEDFGLPIRPAFITAENTVRDSNYHSFRRDQAESGRQISFIALTR
jgi:YfiH family protein